MKNTAKESKIPTWDELRESMEEAIRHPQDTAWNIYRYLTANYKEMGSEEARTLLAAYMKITLPRPSLLHSCILNTALKITQEYEDFRLPAFLRLWGFPANMRKEDLQWRKTSTGRTQPSLKERTERALREYSLEHLDISQKTIGYVDRYDPKHRHYHIFDPMSRHFVAIDPKTPPAVGEYVWFAPVIPERGNFKTASALTPETKENGRKAFGIMEAEVKFVNTEKGYFSYNILTPLPTTPEGSITREGCASLSLAGNTPLSAGNKISVILFLTRRKDGKKHNHIAEIINKG